LSKSVRQQSRSSEPFDGKADVYCDSCNYSEILKVCPDCREITVVKRINSNEKLMDDNEKRVTVNIWLIWWKNLQR